ncbi:MAG TPA: glycosyltransferase family 39 protein, partial [Saprospiraceae bacterium]|nr:glycosyltransferase family 39 protein [Saprospiraceae bacterium]
MSKKKNAPAAAPPPSNAPAVPSTPPSRLPLLLLSVAAALLIGVRLRLLALPLERDEGGFAYIGKMMLGGQRLYTDLYDSKLPGLYGLYGVFVSVFGYHPSGIHLGLLLCNVAAAAWLFLLSRRAFGAAVAAWSVLVFALLSVSPNVLGSAAHATQLLLPFALGGLWLLGRESGRPVVRPLAVLGAGMLLGAAFLIKQQAVFFMPLAALYLWAGLRERQAGLRQMLTPLAALALGAVLPYLTVLGYMAAVGRLPDFWFWTYALPVQFGNSYQPGERWVLFGTVQGFVLRGQWLLWGLAVLGALWVWRGRWAFPSKVLATSLLVLPFGGVLLGSAFYPHYWVLLLPGAALAAAALTGAESHSPLAGKVFSGLLALGLLWALSSNPGYYFRDSHKQVLRKVYNINPFPECAVIGAEIKKRSRPGDEMLVFGAEPELLVSAALPSVTGHIFPYHLLDGQSYNQRFQNELFVAVQERKPRFVAVFTG